MTAVWVGAVILGALLLVTGLGILLGTGTRRADEQAGITREHHDADQRAWLAHRDQRSGL